MLRTLLIALLLLASLPPKKPAPRTKKRVTLRVFIPYTRLPQFATPLRVVQLHHCHCITAIIVFHFIIFTFKSSSRKLTQKFNFLFFFSRRHWSGGCVSCAASCCERYRYRQHALLHEPTRRTHTFDCIFMVISFVLSFSRAVNVLTCFVCAFFFVLLLFLLPYFFYISFASGCRHPPSYLKWSNKHF